RISQCLAAGDVEDIVVVVVVAVDHIVVLQKLPLLICTAVVRSPLNHAGPVGGRTSRVIQLQTTEDVYDVPGAAGRQDGFPRLIRDRDIGVSARVPRSFVLVLNDWGTIGS